MSNGGFEDSGLSVISRPMAGTNSVQRKGRKVRWSGVLFTSHGIHDSHSIPTFTAYKFSLQYGRAKLASVSDTLRKIIHLDLHYAIVAAVMTNHG